MTTKRKRILAPAKVNLCLHVLGRREDNYHDLAMLMQRVSLYDKLDVEFVGGSDIVVSCPGLELAPGEQNIVARAARLLLAHVNIKQGVSIAVEKNIPSAAGLGGGSSDAAAVLEALDGLLDLKLPRSELMMLGARLGADVPFFLYKQTAWATGTGDQFEPWPGLPPVWLVLVNPRVAVSTAWVFQNLGLTRHMATDRIPRFPKRASDLALLLHNDLEIVTCQHYPVITTIKERLLASGARGALMSGSGATVFGLFEDQARAESVARELSDGNGWWAKAVSPL